MRKSIVIICVICVIVALGIFTMIIRFENSNNIPPSTTKVMSIPVDQVAQSPERYNGDIVISGTVGAIVKPHISFTLGCGDACVALPVNFNGPSPAIGSAVLVFGRVSKTVDNKYFIEARRIERVGA